MVTIRFSGWQHSFIIIFIFKLLRKFIICLRRLGFPAFSFSGQVEQWQWPIYHTALAVACVSLVDNPWTIAMAPRTISEYHAVWACENQTSEPLDFERGGPLLAIFHSCEILWWSYTLCCLKIIQFSESFARRNIKVIKWICRDIRKTHAMARLGIWVLISSNWWKIHLFASPFLPLH